MTKGNSQKHARISCGLVKCSSLLKRVTVKRLENGRPLTIPHRDWCYCSQCIANPKPATEELIARRSAADCSAITRISKMSNEEIQRAIDATHPETMDTSRSLAADQLAMMLIHNRQGKREIVNLIRWLLLDSQNARALTQPETAHKIYETTQ